MQQFGSSFLSCTHTWHMLFLIDGPCGKTCLTAVLNAAKKRMMPLHGASASCRHAKLLGIGGGGGGGVKHVSYLTENKHRPPEPSKN